MDKQREQHIAEMKRLEEEHGPEKPLLGVTDLCVANERLHPIARRTRACKKRSWMKIIRSSL